MKVLDSGSRMELEEGDHLWYRHKDREDGNWPDWRYVHVILMALQKNTLVLSGVGHSIIVGHMDLDDYEFVLIHPPKG